MQKEVTRRTATAQMRIRLSQEVFREVLNPKHLKKGNVIETARIAGEDLSLMLNKWESK